MESSAKTRLPVQTLTVSFTLCRCHSTLNWYNPSLLFTYTNREKVLEGSNVLRFWRLMPKGEKILSPKQKDRILLCHNHDMVKMNSHKCGAEPAENRSILNNYQCLYHPLKNQHLLLSLIHIWKEFLIVCKSDKLWSDLCQSWHIVFKETVVNSAD